MPSDLNTKADEEAIAPTDLPNQLESNFSTSEAVKEKSTTIGITIHRKHALGGSTLFR